MTHLLVQKVERANLKKLPEIRPGYTVRVHQKIKEGEKERVQIYEGLVIAMNHGHGASKTMMVRKLVEGIGVEKIFPLHSPNIEKIEVVKIGKVRRSKLFYMRNVSGKAARLKEVLVSKANQTVAEEPQPAAPEEVKTEAAPEVTTNETSAEATSEATENNA
ncbi:50S ribosomal protein L19 [Candidatus Peregrinibacteria bacterium]|nr:50S ribosomal protein L19 [Candidatus Peregrinibacteria bacterium]